MLNILVPPETALDILRIVLVLASLAFALAYSFFLDRPPSRQRTAVKTLAFALLALVPLTLIGSVEFEDSAALVILAVALALSSLGDFFLSLKDEQRFFLLGLAAFLAAHIAYLIVFVPRASIPTAWELAAIVAVIAAAIALLIRLVPRLGKMTVPVVVYATVILGMVAAAISIRDAPWLLGAGAVLFALSDALIAVRKFMQPFPGIGGAVWATYCAAQYLIFLGLLMYLDTH